MVKSSILNMYNEIYTYIIYIVIYIIYMMGVNTRNM